MYKYSFFNDYSEGAHPKILETLLATNSDQEAGYGYDKYSISARRLIKTACQAPEADVYFIPGGTQTNQLVLSSLLKPWQSVIAAESGHIAVHEAGAIEATGHKINTIKTSDGKLTPALIDPVTKTHSDEHMVKPAVVFISNATEVGTVYNKTELIELKEYCNKNKLLLYLDGARIGTALASNGMDLTLSDLPKLTDIFYIGGTKNGALLGEALVINNPLLKEDFFRNIKQRGAAMAKGRILGIQFQELFTDNLYLDLAAHANRMAGLLVTGLTELGISFMTESVTNQIFPIFSTETIAELEKLYGFYVWSEIDISNKAVRLVTSWATKEEAVTEFLSDLKNLLTQP